MSASAPDGKTSLILDKVTPTDRQWINNQIAMINAKEEQAAKAGRPSSQTAAKMATPVNQPAPAANLGLE